MNITFLKGGFSTCRKPRTTSPKIVSHSDRPSLDNGGTGYTFASWENHSTAGETGRSALQKVVVLSPVSVPLSSVWKKLKQKINRGKKLPDPDWQKSTAYPTYNLSPLGHKRSKWPTQQTTGGWSKSDRCTCSWRDRPMPWAFLCCDWFRFWSFYSWYNHPDITIMAATGVKYLMNGIITTNWYVVFWSWFDKYEILLLARPI